MKRDNVVLPVRVILGWFRTDHLARALQEAGVKIPTAPDLTTQVLYIRDLAVHQALHNAAFMGALLHIWRAWWPGLVPELEDGLFKVEVDRTFDGEAWVRELAEEWSWPTVLQGLALLGADRHILSRRVVTPAVWNDFVKAWEEMPDYPPEGEVWTTDYRPPCLVPPPDWEERLEREKELQAQLEAAQGEVARLQQQRDHLQGQVAAEGARADELRREVADLTAQRQACEAALAGAGGLQGPPGRLERLQRGLRAALENLAL